MSKPNTHRLGSSTEAEAAEALDLGEFSDIGEALDSLAAMAPLSREATAETMEAYAEAVEEREALAVENAALRARFLKTLKAARDLAEPANAPPVAETASEALRRVAAGITALMDAEGLS
ncbi:MAG: hypothetical protein AAGM38_09845 [Pseudomonadota bacterium]